MSTSSAPLNSLVKTLPTTPGSVIGRSWVHDGVIGFEAYALVQNASASDGNNPDHVWVAVGEEQEADPDALERRLGQDDWVLVGEIPVPESERVEPGMLVAGDGWGGDGSETNLWLPTNGEEMAATHPNTFSIPSRQERENVQPGHAVKAAFTHPVGWGDRPWLDVVEVRDGIIYTRLQDLEEDAVRYLIALRPEHILDIWTVETWEALGKAIQAEQHEVVQELERQHEARRLQVEPELAESLRQQHEARKQD